MIMLVFSCVRAADANDLPRVIVSSDIGGTDPDDFQSMVHLLLCADSMDLEGIVSSHIAGNGALGEFFAAQLGGMIKMGDSPSVGWLLKGNDGQPSQPGWGGRFVRAWNRGSVRFDRMTGADDRMECFGVAELALPLGEDSSHEAEARLVVDNQSLAGHFPGDGTVRFRFCPKDVKTHVFEIRSNLPSLDGQCGGITAVAPAVGQSPSAKYPNWWTDDPDPRFAEGVHQGAETVSRWREEFLGDFAGRMRRVR